MSNYKTPERYISFKNIDCHKKARLVLDEVLAVLEDSTFKNPFWERFETKIPQRYYKNEEDEDILYLVCSNVFYIEELFEDADSTKGEELISDCEFDCC